MASTRKKIWGILASSMLLLLAGGLMVVMLMGQSRAGLGQPFFWGAEPTPVPPPVTPPTPPPTPPPPSPTPLPSPYLFGVPLAEGTAVEDSWFSDAVFLGDSRTEGLQLYSGLKTATFFCYRGLSVFTAKTRACINVDEETLTLMEAIQTGQWGKVYIMFGLNELGYAADAFEQGLLELVDMIALAQPEAVIYLQTLPPVNEDIARSRGSGGHINNSKVAAFNEVVHRVAENRQTVLVDVAAALQNEEGILAEEHTSDGVHFRRAGYQLWLDYLRRHTIEPDHYIYSRVAPPVEPEPEPAPSDTPLPEPEPVEELPPAEEDREVVPPAPRPGAPRQF